MEEGELAGLILDIVQLSPDCFEKELEKVTQHPLVLYLLTEVLSSTLPHKHKQLAASGINLVVKIRIDGAPLDWPAVWQSFSQQVLLHREVQQIDWTYLRILAKAVEALLDEFGVDFPAITNHFFEQVGFKGKVLLYGAFVVTELTLTSKYLFLRETIEDYLHQGLTFVCWLHDHPVEQHPANLQLEADILANLELILNSLENEREEVLTHLLLQLSLGDDIFMLVVEELLFNWDKKDFVSVVKEEFSVHRMGELVLSSQEGDQGRQQHQNAMKAKAITIFTSVLQQYDRKASITEFDHYKNLHLMEQLIPLAVSHLGQLAKAPLNQDLELELVVVAMLKLLLLGCQFNFHLEYFVKSYKQLLFRICYPMLGVDKEEQKAYKQDPSSFIGISEEMVERQEDSQMSLRNGASDLLQKLIDTVDGSISFLVNVNITIIRRLLLPNSHLQPSSFESQLSLSWIQDKFGCCYSVETSLTMLTVLSGEYLHRENTLRQFRHSLLTAEILSELQGLSLAKFLIFLAYNYEAIYEQHQHEAFSFLKLASELLPHDNSHAASAQLFFSNCTELGFGPDILHLLLSAMEKQSSNQHLLILKKGVVKWLESLSVQCILELVRRLMRKLIEEFRICEQGTKEGGMIRGSPMLLECLSILEEIASRRKYLQREAVIVEALWPVFDLFEFTSRIEFEDNILRIFNCLAQVSPALPQSFFRFVESLPNIFYKTLTFSSELLLTYNLLLSRGKDHFLYNRGLEDLLAILQALKMSYGVAKYQENLRHVCIFYHYVYRVYWEVLERDDSFLSKLLEVYTDQKEGLKEETLAAIINIFLIAEARYGSSQPPIIQDNSITIFRDYQAEMVALSFGLIIQQHPHEERVLDYLRYSIRLLHFLRGSKLALENCPQTYYRPDFLELSELDPFTEVCRAIDFLKGELEKDRYDSLMKNIKSQISGEEMKDLLGWRLVKKELRRVVRVSESSRTALSD